MSMKSGEDTPSEMELNVPSVEQPSGGPTRSIIKPVGTNSSNKLPVVDGRSRRYKESLKSALVDYVQEESDADISPESVEILHRFVENSSRGFVSTIPMKCQGEGCSYLSVCPLYAAGSVLPVGKACPVEQWIAAANISKHLESLGIDDVTDPAHSFDMDMLCEMAGLELIRWRCGAQLAERPQLTISQVVNVTDEGEEIFQEVANPVIDIMDRTGKSINKLRDALVATRKAQIEAGKNVMDSTQKASDLREKANELIMKRRQEAELRKKENIIKIEGTNE